VFAETNSSLCQWKKVNIEFRMEQLITRKCERGVAMFETYLMNTDTVVLPVLLKALAMKQRILITEILSIPKQLLRLALRCTLIADG
jgi:hypothetical protein